jgi:tetratricopeptide (TPR) repeat protein
MSDTASAQGQALAPDANPLGKALGLNAAELETLGAVFVEATRSLGIEGGPIFERLKQGQPLGQALGMPEGVGDLLYARAYRWFSVGRVDKAERLFRTLCLLNKDSANYWVGYGVCLRLRGRPNEAAMSFAAAARLKPDWAVPYFHALELAVHLQKWEAATQYLARFDELASDDIAEAIRAEVERLRSAVALRTGAAQP